MIYNEDCRVTMTRMQDNAVDYVITSPPYNRKRNDKYAHFDDICDNYFEFLDSIITELLRIKTKTIFFNIAHNYYNRSDVLKIIGKYADKISDIIVWVKTNPLPAQGTNITNAYEFFLCIGERPKSKKTYTKNLFSTSIAKMPKEHKAVMHIDACRYIFEHFIEENSLIYDPFLGLGTTAICADEYNCYFIGSEISEKYFMLAQQRLKKHQQQLKLF